jgi:hypothetical protein
MLERPITSQAGSDEPVDVTRVSPSGRRARLRDRSLPRYDLVKGASCRPRGVREDPLSSCGRTTVSVSLSRIELAVRRTGVGDGCA